MIEPGIYEQIINALFKQKIKTTDRDAFYIKDKRMGRDEAATILSRYLYRLFQKLFASLPDDDSLSARCVNLANAVITKLGREFDLDDYENNLIDAQASILTAVVDKSQCDYPDIATYVEQITPITSLSKSTLFTGLDQTVNMASELKKEILSSDEICFVVSFIRKSGLNLIKDELKRVTNKGKKLRVITTTYMRATQYEAITELAQMPNTEIRISYNGEEDRLHAKAYLFLRNSGFHTAYIGSSNISHAALTKGLEWNLKATQIELPYIITTVRNSFESYWNDATFEPFVLGRDDERLKEALNQERLPEIDYSVLDIIRAKDYQREILEKLDVERMVHGHFRNLVVAATGTGKTVIAAFDFKRFMAQLPRRHNFLFVVHREEIIKQACQTFRHVLNDQNFGEMWYGGHEARSFNHLFASKDMLNNRLDAMHLEEDYYDYIVIDEVHHASADSYRKILNHFKPKILLGLTATPERMDGQDITRDFDGHISAEIRLTAALNAGLLTPFNYYGITDSVDLEHVKWERGRFVASELSKVYTGNDRRTQVIWKAMERYLDNYNDVRALCFCVDKDHAKYMNAKFTLANLRSDVLTSDDSKEHRSRVRRKLRNKEINYLFVVDMFNEGIDIPEIDTVLFLRPTESLTIYLQQLGRGLRRAEGKDHLTVLDFVGHSRKEFNYQARFRALMGRTSMGVKEEIEKGFPHLPLNCHITLEEKAQEYIIENIEGALRATNKDRIVKAVRNFKRDFFDELTLSNFMRLTGISLDKIYKTMNWYGFLFSANILDRQSPYAHELQRAVFLKWLSTDSFSYFSFVQHLAQTGFSVREEALSPIERKMALMFYYDVFDSAGRFSCIQEMFDTLAKDHLFVGELKEVMDELCERCSALEKDDNSAYALIMPLKVHGIYTKSQIQVAIETSTINKKSSSREGCERNKALNLEAMYVDIIKDREEGSTTNYNDFALSRNEFHWETQNTVSPQTPVGQNYINKTQHMLLFIRQQATIPEDKRRRMGYIYLGEVDLVSCKGARPMQIVWKLRTPMAESAFGFAAKFKAIG